MALRSLRVSLRFILPLTLVFALFAYAVVPLVDHLTLRWFISDLETRSEVLANTLQEPLTEYVTQGATGRIKQLFDRAVRDERLYALAFCDARNVLLYKTASYPDSLRCSAPAGDGASLMQLPQGQLHVTARTLDASGKTLGTLLLVHDVRFIERRTSDAKQYIVGLFVLLAVVISLITGLVAHWSWRTWIASVKSFLKGRETQQRQSDSPPEIQPLIGDLRALLHEIDSERRVLDEINQTWTPDTLRTLLREQLAGDEVLVVSNRD